MPSHNNKPSLVLSSSSHLLPASKGGGVIDTKSIIATYELIYQKGKVIALGIYADDIITNRQYQRESVFSVFKTTFTFGESVHDA